MAVTVVFAATDDGDVGSTNATYANASQGTGAFTSPVNVATELWEGQLLLGNYSCYESFVRFPSSIASGQVVTSAVMQTWLITNNTPVDFNCIALVFDWGAGVTSADWRTPLQQQAMGTWWTTLATSGLGAPGAYQSWNNSTDLHALLTLYAVTGTDAKFCLSSDRLLSALAPGGAEFVTWSSADVAGTTQDPKITITHAEDLVAQPVASGVVLGGTTALTLEFPAEANVTADLVLELDLDRDGVPEVDVTGDLMALDWLTGRDFPSGLTGETKPGQLKATFNNEGGRFSYAAATPVGVLCRLRMETAVNDDPVLLARDRFDRADGVLGLAETGQSWSVHDGSFTIRSRTAAAGDSSGGDNAATLDTGSTNHYVQASLRQMPFGNDTRLLGLYARYIDINNYARASYNTVTRRVFINENNAGAFGTIASSSAVDLLNGFEGMTLGLGVVGNVVTAYLDGVAVCSGTLAHAPTGTRAGVFSIYGGFTGRSPELADFHVWDHVITDTPGVLWTGDVASLALSVDVLGTKVATLVADGQLLRASGAEVAAPRLAAGAPTGVLVGNVLHRAGLLHPPAPLDMGAVRTGPIGLDDAKAIDLARMFEDTEQGFIYEPPEGGVSFQSSTARAVAPVKAWFSDTPGVGQYPFHRIEPADRRAQLINRVTAGVANDAPSGITWTQQSGGGHTDIVMPTVNDDDLVLVLVVNSQTGGHDWLNPIWWDNHRDLKGAYGLRIYSHRCVAGDTGTTTRLREWISPEIGIWFAFVVRIEDWFKGNDGLLISAPVAGDDPSGLDVTWGRKASMFLAIVAAVGGGAGGMSFAGLLNPPDGYDWLTGIGGVALGAADAQDAGLLGAMKLDVTDAENPTSFPSFTNTLILESIVIAVRGFNGPHTKATLDDPGKSVGGDGRFVTVDSLDSQATYNAVLSHRLPSNLFASEADAQAYGDSIVAAYGQERPIITLAFWATKRGSMRDQAVNLRVGDLVYVTASGDTGLDTEGEFFIEAIGGAVSNGGTLWEHTYWLSPA